MPLIRIARDIHEFACPEYRVAVGIEGRVKRAVPGLKHNSVFAVRGKSHVGLEMGEAVGVPHTADQIVFIFQSRAGIYRPFV